MGKPMDISKFRKGITKSIDGISAGFRDPDTWISTGNYALNYLISGDFNKGIPLGKVSMFSGQSGAGKSYIVSGNIVKNAQAQGIYCVVMDTESALDSDWLTALGVDTSEEKMLKFNVSKINDAAQIINEFVKDYKNQPPEDRQKVLFVIDSIGMMSSAIGVQQFVDNNMKGDFGSKPKELMALVRNCLNMFGDLNIGLVCTNHSYSSQDPYSPDDKISGGCLVDGMLVKMDSGDYKNIKDIEIGEFVHTKSGSKEVINTWQYNKPTITLELSDGFVIECTAEHKFLILRGNKEVWVAASDLVENDAFVQNI